MCTRCHFCVWSRHQAKLPAGEVPWDPHFDARSPKKLSSVAVRTPDPPMVLHRLHDDRDGEGFPSAARTPLQAGDDHLQPAVIMANELSKKLQSLQLHQGMDQQPSTRDGSGPGDGSGSDSCRTPETKGMLTPHAPGSTRRLRFKLMQVDSGSLPMKLPVPPLSTAPEIQAVPGRFASAENVQDECFEPPHPTPESVEDEECGFQEAPVIISVGSVGHPQDCGAPCKYARRKGGCTDGKWCTNCHQCQWACDRLTAAPALTSSFSAGSADHPERCGQPCKYVRRKTGCRHGERCPDCHLCQWCRQPPAEEDAAPVARKPDGVPPPPPPFGGNTSTEALSDLWPCVGSVGHPYACAGLGCKYSHKARGCKDGKLCTRCHLCRWNRYDKYNMETQVQLS